MKKLILAPLTAFLIASLALVFAGCENNGFEDAGDDVGDALEDAGDEVDDAID